MLKYIFKNSLLYTISENITLFLNIILLPILTPFLSPSDYAIWGLTFSVIGIISLLGHLGISVFLFNAYFQNSENYQVIWSKYFTINVLWNILFFFIELIVLYFFLNEYIKEFIIILISMVIIPNSIFSTTIAEGRRLLQYEKKHNPIFVNTLVTSIVGLLISFIGIYYFKLGYKAWFFSNFIVGCFQFIFFSYHLHFKHGIKFIFPEWNDVKTILKSAPFITPNTFLSQILNNSDRLILEKTKTSITLIGEYNIAYNLGSFANKMSSTVSTLLSPDIIKEFKSTSKLRNTTKILTQIVWVYIFIALALSIWAKEIFEFLYRNPSLSIAYKYFPLIVFSFTFLPFYNAFYSISNFGSKFKKVLIYNIVTILIYLPCAIILIKYYSAWGAAISTFGGYLMQSSFHFALKKIRIFQISRPLVLALIVNPIFCGLSYMVLFNNTDTSYRFFITFGILLFISVLFMKIKQFKFTA